jgi:hypothetical protein
MFNPVTNAHPFMLNTEPVESEPAKLVLPFIDLPFSRSCMQLREKGRRV